MKKPYFLVFFLFITKGIAFPVTGSEEQETQHDAQDEAIRSIIQRIINRDPKLRDITEFEAYPKEHNKENLMSGIQRTAFRNLESANVGDKIAARGLLFGAIRAAFQTTKVVAKNILEGAMEATGLGTPSDSVVAESVNSAVKEYVPFLPSFVKNTLARLASVTANRVVNAGFETAENFNPIINQFKIRETIGDKAGKLIFKLLTDEETPVTDN